jgi:ABC-type Mn2+/Zn2+ transport system permease subunit
VGWLTDPFKYQFMQHALIAAVLIGVTCAVLGVYVVQRRLAFVGDAMAHTTLPGLVVAHLCGWSLSVGGLAAAAVTAVAIAWVSGRQRVREDTAIGVVFTGMFAVGVLLMSRAGSFRDLSHMLFGNVLGVTTADLWLIGGVAVVVLVALFLFHKELELTSFDPTHAAVIGLRAGLMRLLLLGLLALAVVTGIQAVGVILTNALLVTPAAAASLLTDSFPRRMLYSALIAAGSAVVGLVASYLLHASSGASMVLTCTAVFLLAAAVAAVRRRLRPAEPGASP